MEYASEGDAAFTDDLLKPIKSVEEKWKLLPHFLRMRGLMRQHIDSFDNFINVEIKKIVAAKSNCEVRSEADPKFFLRYTDIYIGTPNIEEEAFVTSNGSKNNLVSFKN
jgi:DNA-directed RNA polymerase III subunit RPC2